MAFAIKHIIIFITATLFYRSESWNAHRSLLVSKSDLNAAYGASRSSFLLLDRRSEENDGPNYLEILSNNPIVLYIRSLYSFFYWLPRENVAFDSPPDIFKNSTRQWIAWYQFPRNLPPYRYVGGAPSDFFCYGLPGNTLPLGDWDPWGLQLVSPKVVKKYRESEIKHGRLAMLATIGFTIQEIYHPLHPNIGGLSVTHMSQLRERTVDDSILNFLPIDLDVLKGK